MRVMRGFQNFQGKIIPKNTHTKKSPYDSFRTSEIYYRYKLNWPKAPTIRKEEKVIFLDF